MATTPQMVAPDGNSYVTGSSDLSHSEIDAVDASGGHAVLKLNRAGVSALG